MAKSIEELIGSLTHEEFADFVDSHISEEELAHWGVLGMKWGVRKDRGTGKRVGTPVAGTKAASRSTPSVTPAASRKTATGETSIGRRKSDKRVVAKLTDKQKSKLGREGLSAEDLSLEQLRSAAERLRLESEITKMLDGPTKDQAMQAVVARIKLEQEYARLTAKPPTTKQKVIKKTKEILGSVLETQTKAVLNAAAKNQVDKFLKSQGIKPFNEGKKKGGDQAPAEKQQPPKNSSGTTEEKKKKK